MVTWGAPIQANREAAIAAISRMGWLERLFILQTPLAQAVCSWMCEHRAAAGWLAVTVKRWASDAEPDDPLASSY